LLAQLETEGLAEAPDQRAERDDRTAELRARMVVAQDELRGQLGSLETDLKDIARRNGSLKGHIQSLQSALTATENKRAVVAEAHQRLGRMLSERELALAHERSDKAELAATVVEKNAEVAEWKNRFAALAEVRDALVGERDLLQGDLDSERAAKAALGQEVARLTSELDKARSRVVAVAGERDGLSVELDELRAKLKQASLGREALKRHLSDEVERVADARARIDALERRRSELESGTAQLARALRAGKKEEAVLVERVSGLKAQLAEAGGRIADLRKERDAQRRRVAALSGSLDGSRQQVAALEGQLFSLTRTLDGADRKAEALAEQRDVLRARLVEARGELAQQAQRHDAVIQGLSDRTRQSIDTMEELLLLTGLDIKAVIDEASSKVEGDGKGGPFVPYDEVPELPMADRSEAVLGALDDRIRRWEALQLVLAATPLAAPLATEFRITSRAGKRKDPLNGRLSRHDGVDMVAPYRTPIVATAPGVVAFAGWLSGYGRVVDIDHGFGITTRYAHLRRIDVETGQRVGFHDQIGQLGNSGRSTGAHVHYEVRFKDKPLDPLKFMKAASHVLKG
ncbi:MAG: peptidoglycan DD-metalloendopeptidase family protein, partial [Tistlia sp.]